MGIEQKTSNVMTSKELIYTLASRSRSQRAYGVWVEKQTGISRRTVESWFQGLRTPSVMNLMRVLRAHGVYGKNAISLIKKVRKKSRTQKKRIGTMTEKTLNRGIGILVSQKNCAESAIELIKVHLQDAQKTGGTVNIRHLIKLITQTEQRVKLLDEEFNSLLSQLRGAEL